MRRQKPPRGLKDGTFDRGKHYQCFPLITERRNLVVATRINHFFTAVKPVSTDVVTTVCFPGSLIYGQGRTRQ
jgi:hypothetical protein